MAPTNDGRARGESAGSASADASPDGRARILIIDDEPYMGRILARLLSDTYDVVTCGAADEGLAMIEQGERFDIVLCDMIMPRMNGMALFARIERQHPEMATRILFMTGGTLAPEMRAFLEKLPGRVLEKPFDYPELEKLVRKMVASGTAGTGRASPPPQ